MSYELLFLKSLTLTILIESIVVYLLVNDISSKYRKLAMGIIPSFATLPYIWFIFPAIFGVGRYYIVFSEAFAIFIETIIIFFISNINLKRALYISLLANISSYLISKIII